MTQPVSDDRVAVPGHVVVRAMPDATVLLNARTGRDFTLDDVGSRAWALLSTSSSIRIAYDALQSEFDVTPDALRRDLADLVDRLSAEGLLERLRG